MSLSQNEKTRAIQILAQSLGNPWRGIQKTLAVCGGDACIGLTRNQNGHSVTIHHEDGTSTVEHFHPQDNLIVLDPDVKIYFPDSESVNSTAVYGD